MMLLRLPFVLTAFIASAALVKAEPIRTGNVVSELVSEVRTIEAGRPFVVGLRMVMDEHWHTYWINAGDAGAATSIAWELPEGFSAGPIQWPAPQLIPTPPLMNYGYEGEILLMTEITPPANLPVGGTIRIGATVDWLVCKEVCIPGQAKHTLELTAGAGPAQMDTDRAGLFAEARRRLPVKGGSNWPAEYSVQGQELVLEVVVPPGTTVPLDGLYFFPMREMVVEPAKPQRAALADGRLKVRLPRAEVEPVSPTVLEGVLAAQGGFPPDLAGRAVSLSARQVVASVVPVSGSGAPAASTSFALTAILAFVGGLILNLMPCVFPVLGIKILGFVNQAGADRRKVTMHGWVFTLGVLMSFWTLAGALIALRAGGEELGWGFQLQSPAFVFGLSVFLLVFALNLSGLFEVGLSATGVGSSLQMRSGYSGSYFTGVLATVVATPCAAPFLAPALGAALTLPPLQSFVLFSLIGLGLSAPYLILSAFPALVRLLPRPGAWMESFKQLMAFPLYATVGFLVWVLAGQVSEGQFLMVLFGLVLVAMAGWAYGRWVQQGRSAGAKGIGLVFGLAALVIGLVLGYPRSNPTEIAWQPWSPETVAQLRADGRTIYVDFTARWCATCQTNKKLVFASDDVREAFRERNIVPLKADWTNKDPAITNALAAFGRSAVPFNLIYSPGSVEPIVLPELLTPGIVLDALDRAAGSSRAANAR